VPWWGAVLIAVVACAIGFAFDAGSGGRTLTSVFAVLYAMGCLTAALAVRRSGLFTAVIQPPLLLFVIVPGAFFLMHGSDIRGIKDILINCGYPLIERFPLMFFTSAAVLVVGLARRFLGARVGTAAAAKDKDTAAAKDKDKDKAKAGKAGGSGRARVAATSAGDEASAEETPRRRASSTRRKAAEGARPERPAKRTAPARSRHSRPADTEIIEPVVDLDRPRRRRPRPDDAPDTGAEPRRRARPSSSSTREARVSAGERRRSTDRSERPTRRPRYDGFEPLDARGSDAPVSPGTHHPISRVRYRGGDDAPDYGSDYGSDYGNDDDAAYRPRRRDVDADRWEYDI